MCSSGACVDRDTDDNVECRTCERCINDGNDVCVAVTSGSGKNCMGDCQECTGANSCESSGYSAECCTSSPSGDGACYQGTCRDLCSPTGSCFDQVIGQYDSECPCTRWQDCDMCTLMCAW